MVCWEQELQKSFPISCWLEASEMVSKLSKCVNHKEIMRKIHLRWYLTPNRVQHIKPRSSKFCWKKCGEMGTQLHMWWSCPVSQRFWIKVEALISEILPYKFSLSPELAILNISLKEIPTSFRSVVLHILISARYVIAQNWNLPITLPITEVIRRTNFQYQCETRVLTSPSQTAKQVSLWTPWSDSKYCLRLPISLA